MKENHRVRQSVDQLNARRVKLSGNLLGLRAMYLDLQARATQVVAPDEKHRLAGQLVAIARLIEDMDRDLSKALNTRASTIIADLYREMRDVIAEMAKEHGLVAVHGFPGNPGTENPLEMEMLLKAPAVQPFYLDPSVDYTDELIRRLNDKYDADGNGR
jgi:hypothetical protein